MKRPELPGITYDEPNAVYHANEEYNSFSNVKTAMKGPELYKKTSDGLITVERKDAWDIGNVVHEQILEPEKPSEFVLTDPSYADMVTKDKTAYTKKLNLECKESGKKLLNLTNSDTARECVKAIRNDPANALFKQGDAEVTFRFETRNFKFQCRTDWICHSAPAGLEGFGIEEGMRYVADLKTTQSVDDWMNEARWKNPLSNEFFYAGQEAFYTPIIDRILSDGGHGKIDKWVFVVVEKKEPFRVGVFATPDYVLEWATGEVNEAINNLVNRKNTGNWKDERLDGVYEPAIYLRSK